MPKIKIDALDEALEAIAGLSVPRTQAEWRKASTALRTARRINRTRKRAMTVQIMCGGSHRYLHAETYGSATGCYTGARGLGSLRMIQHHVFLYREGSTKGRVADARYFATVCRREGPVPLPDLRSTITAAMAKHAAAYEAERGAKRRGVAGHTYAVLSAARDAAWRELRQAMGADLVNPAGEVERITA